MVSVLNEVVDNFECKAELKVNGLGRAVLLTLGFSAGNKLNAYGCECEGLM